MAKHRKTRKQKLRSDIRQKQVVAPSSEITSPQQVQSPTVFSYSQTSASTTKKLVNAAPIDTTYNYIGHDLRKTGLITGSIIVAEFILMLAIR